MSQAAGIDSEALLLAIAGALARGESATSARAVGPARSRDALVAAVRSAIVAGADPLGDAFCSLRTPAVRRPSGAVYTPSVLVDAMLERAAAQGAPARVVDAGAGSGRFLLAAARRFPNAALVAVETDPLALAILRANVAVRGLASRVEIVPLDYRLLELPKLSGRTLFLGNPPYVRHHGIPAPMKQWLSARAAELGFGASQLAGLHVHFLLATALHSRAGDGGVLVTSAEWLDVGYGSLLRELLVGPLGLTDLHLLEPSVRAFDDADTTAVVMAFEVGARPERVKVRAVRALAALAPLRGGRALKRERLAQASRWTPLVRDPAAVARDAPELGEFFEVHRGQVTGKNLVWIAGSHSDGLPPAVLFPSVTRARELFRAGTALTSLDELRRVIDLPPELDSLDAAERRSVERFLRIARRMGAHEGFIASHRKRWWSVGLRQAAPILVTYMARRPPAFVHNAAGARHLNIAHGLYPRASVPATSLARIARHLSAHTPQSGGRTYAGGLTKFEPSELLRLRISGLAELLATGTDAR